MKISYFDIPDEQLIANGLIPADKLTAGFLAQKGYFNIENAADITISLCRAAKIRGMSINTLKKYASVGLLKLEEDGRINLRTLLRFNAQGAKLATWGDKLTSYKGKIG